MCCSEERGEIGSSQHIFDIKSPMIFFFYLSVFADVFNIFKMHGFFCVPLYLVQLYFMVLGAVSITAKQDVLSSSWAFVINSKY